MMITAYGDAENHDTQPHSLGADDFLTKPLNFGLLKEKFKNMQ
jgi:two-component system, chemotaxis family, chemotaxis protein CheY